jgi:hypothetical protein
MVQPINIFMIGAHMEKLMAALTASFALMGAVSSVSAQEVAPSPSVSQSTPDNSCVVELWVAKRYDVATQSGLGVVALGVVGGLIEEAMNKERDSGKKTELMEIISPEFIKNVFMSTDLTTRLNKEVVEVNYHTLSDDKAEINSLLSSKVRSVPSDDECYREVFVKEISVQQNGPWVKMLMLSFQIKKFSGQNVLKAQNDMRVVELSLFPTKDPAKKEQAAENLRQAFRTAVTKFVEKRVN